MAAAAGATGSNGNAFPPSPQPCPEGRIHTHLLLTCKLANEEQALDMYLNNGASKCVCVCESCCPERMLQQCSSSQGIGSQATREAASHMAEFQRRVCVVVMGSLLVTDG